MYDKLKELLNEEVKALLLKTVIPIMIGVSMRLALDARTRKVTFFEVLTSFVLGIGMVYLLYFPVREQFGDVYQPLVYGSIAMFGDRFGLYMMKKFNIEAWLINAFDFVTKFIKK